MCWEFNIVIGQNVGKDDLICSGNQYLVLDRKIVLVVEDILSNYLLILVMLFKYYNLFYVVNGEQVVVMVKEYKIDFLLMDMKMLVMDGLMVIVEIRKFDMNIFIVVFIVYVFEFDKVVVLKFGCNDYFVKLVDKVRLMFVLCKYCYFLIFVL